MENMYRNFMDINLRLCCIRDTYEYVRETVFARARDSIATSMEIDDSGAGARE